MQDDFDRSIASLVAAMADALYRWWLIGGAAAALLNADYDNVQDIDVVCSTADARRLVEEHGFRDVTDGGSGGLRSKVRARADTPVAIDILGGFEILVDDVWTSFQPGTLRLIETPGGAVYLPSAEELNEIMVAIGRAKDQLKL